MTTPSFPPEYAITRCTVRLQAGVDARSLTSVGTGFFYKIVHPTTNIAKVLVITNKHVVRGAQVVRFVISSAHDISFIDQHAQPVGRTDESVDLNLSGNLYEHPDSTIDLCGIDVTIPIGQVLQRGTQLRSAFLDFSWLPEVSDKALLRDIEQVLVIGYPRGIWDEHNNMPISRVGTTATHPLARYQGKPNFLVDVAAFGGSSGSPVFTHEGPLFRQRNGAVTPGTKYQFIGVIWGVLEQTVLGQLQQVEVPAALTDVPIHQASLNLAIALHGEAILALDELVFPGIGAARA